MKRLLTLLTLLLAMAVPGLASAASVPVYIDGERMPVQALEQGGATYLPMRAIFEALGAEVDWQEQGQRITASFASGIIIHMQAGSPDVRIIWGENGESEGQEENAPFLRRGTVYVPLRFVAETLQYEVDWRNNRVYLQAPTLAYETYTLNLLTGELREKTAGLLGRVDLPSVTAPHSWYPPYEFKVEQTPAGNYLFVAQANGSGALSFHYQLAAWLPAGNPAGARTYLTHSIMEELPEVMALAGKLWFSDDEIGVICLDEQTGQAVEYRAAAIYNDEYARAFCHWTDGRFLVLNKGGLWSVYDIQNQKLIDMAAELVTAEIKAEAEAFLQAQTSRKTIAAEDFAMYWDYLGVDRYVASPTPALWFEGAQGRELLFKLVLSYWQEQEGGGLKAEREYIPLAYQLPE